MKKESVLSVRVMCEVGLMAAAGFVLDALAGVLFKGIFPSGGSISIAMIAVLIIAFRRGFLPALGVGVIMGLFDLMKGPYLIAASPDRVFFQLLLDYLIAYPLVSLAGFFRPLFERKAALKKGIGVLLIGGTIGGLAKFLSHYASGVIFWSDPGGFAWGLNSMSPYLYSFIYNIAYCGPSIALSLLLLCLIYKKAPRILLANGRKAVVPKEKKSKPAIIVSSATLALALATFTFFLVRYILSSETWADSYGTSISFDKVALNIMIIGFVYALTAAMSIANAARHYDWRFYPIVMSIASSISLLASVASLVKMLQKGEIDPTVITWFAISVALFAGTIAYYLVRDGKKKKADLAEKTNE